MTRHGPIIDDIVTTDSFPAPRSPLSMRWTIWDNSDEAQALYLLNRAGNIEDVEQAASHHKCPGQNWIYADDEGNIGFWAAVGIPIREEFAGDKILPGWDGKHEWAGYVPTERQPHLRNPPRGWLATANNRHAGDDYPYVISNSYAPPDRFIRISRMLTERDKLAVDDFKQMQADVYMIMAETWIPLILAAVDPDAEDDLYRRALDTLRHWDYMADSGGVAPAVFHVLFQKTTEHMLKERLGDTLYQRWLVNAFIVYDAMQNLIRNAGSAWFDNPETETIETRDDVLSLSFAEAVDFLDSTFGEDMSKWIWGRLHYLSLQHPVGAHIPVLGGMMNVGPFRMGGASNTINAGLYRLTRPWRMLAGSSQRHIFDLGDIENSLRIIPTGISGNFMSDHYNDQVESWRRVDYRPFHLDRKNVEADAKYRIKMIPAEAADAGELAS
jgi:penicillin amidase